MEKKTWKQISIAVLFCFIITMGFQGCDLAGDPVVIPDVWQWSLGEYAVGQTFNYEVAFDDGNGNLEEGDLEIAIFQFDWGAINREMIVAFENEMSSSAILNIGDSRIPNGTIFLYKTSAGDFGKLRLIDNDYGDNFGWIFDFVTYTSTGGEKVAKNNVELIGTGIYNLDTGDSLGQTDFWLRHTGGDRYFYPENGAEFYIIQEGIQENQAMVKWAGEFDGQEFCVFGEPEPLTGDLDSALAELVIQAGTKLMATDFGKLTVFLWDIVFSRGFEGLLELENEDLSVGFEKTVSISTFTQDWTISIPGLITLAGIDGYAMDIGIKTTGEDDVEWYYNFYFSDQLPQFLRIYEEVVADGSWRLLTLTGFSE